MVSPYYLYNWKDRTNKTERLKQHQHRLLSEYSTHLLPILQTPADKSKGEIFPTVWYTTDEQVTGAQHLELARMILIAENPRLRYAPFHCRIYTTKSTNKVGNRTPAPRTGRPKRACAQ